MSDQIFRSSEVSAYTRSNHVDVFIEIYKRHLRQKGYAYRSILGYLRALEHFLLWLTSEGIAVTDVTSSHVQRFLYEHLPNCRCTFPAPTCRNTVRAAIKQWLIVAPHPLNRVDQNDATSKQIAATLDAYDHYLGELAGLAESTRLSRRRYVREFLTTLFKSRLFDLHALTPATIVSYVSGRARGLRPGSVHVMASSLRSYLKFLRFTGERGTAPPEAVPKTPNWRLASLPATLDEPQIKKLLGSFDRSHPSGRRDYAIARCLVDLGLRTCEVASLTLDDIDWRHGTITIARRKSHRTQSLPLPAATGVAIMEYLRKGRPSTAVRFLFVHHRAPLGQGVAPSTIRGAIRRAYQRAGFALQRVHVLRHTAATRMLRGGASLKSIADVLGHRSLDSSAIYAKVDVEKLTDVAMPWPGRSA